MTKFTISIAHDFSPSPAGRYKKDGPFNAERFRDDHLVPALERAIQEHGKLVVDFADADSYSSSFLEEVFGGLVRKRKFSPSVLKSNLELKSDNPVYAAYVADAREYIENELNKTQS